MILFIEKIISLHFDRAMLSFGFSQGCFLQEHNLICSVEQLLWNKTWMTCIQQLFLTQ